MVDVKDAPKPKTDNGPAQAQAQEVARREPTDIRRPAGNPFAFMHRFAEQMDQLFEEFGLEAGLHMPSLLTRGRELVRREAGLVPAEWSPRVDVMERNGQYVVRADLPGLTKDDIHVEITHEQLTIRGERRQEKKSEREGYAYRECSYGSFFRAIPLPEGAETAKATADFRNGVLEIAMPLPEHAGKKSRRLEVREGK